jgi:hypothetical protein
VSLNAESTTALGEQTSSRLRWRNLSSFMDHLRLRVSDLEHPGAPPGCRDAAGPWSRSRSPQRPRPAASRAATSSLPRPAAAAPRVPAPPPRLPAAPRLTPQEPASELVPASPRPRLTLATVAPRDNYSKHRMLQVSLCAAPDRQLPLAPPVACSEPDKRSEPLLRLRAERVLRHDMAPT